MPLWTVLYEEALTEWETRRRPAGEQFVAVLEWLLDMVDTGPRPSTRRCRSRRTSISARSDIGMFATYLALSYERRVVIRRID